MLAGSTEARKKKIIIHLPQPIKKQKHTHTLVKTVHHHHKPTVIKEEKIIKQEVKIHKPVTKVREEVEHEHFHHHYSHNHDSGIESEHDFGSSLGGGQDHHGGFHFESKSSHP